MNQHQGVHPRIGALDVMPFVPLVGSTMRDAVTAAHAVGQELAREYDLPVFFYGEAALLPARRDLPIVRAGEFEGLAARLTDPAWRPDAGPTTPHPTAGAAIVGARRILIAFNAWLGTSDVDAARSIARAIRESSGGLPAVRAIGVALPSRNVVQVAMNLLDYRRTSVPIVIERVEREAVRFGVRVVDYELVGCAPADAFAPPLSRAVRLRPSQLLEAELLTESRPEP
jgi:glutamate formiminotransferase